MLQIVLIENDYYQNVINGVPENRTRYWNMYNSVQARAWDPQEI